MSLHTVVLALKGPSSANQSFSYLLCLIRWAKFLSVDLYPYEGSLAKVPYFKFLCDDIMISCISSSFSF